MLIKEYTKGINYGLSTFNVTSDFLGSTVKSSLLGVGVGEMIQETNNKRFRLLTKGKNRYLLDMDSNKIVWLFPWIWYFFSFKVYILKDIPKGLEVSKKRKNTTGLIIILSTIIAGILIRNIDENFWKKEIINNFAIRIIFVLVVISFVFCIRIIQSNKMRNRIHLENIQEISEVKIDTSQKINSLIRILILYSLMGIFLYYFLKYKYILSFICFFSFFYIMLRLNLNLVFSDESKIYMCSNKKKL